MNDICTSIEQSHELFSLLLSLKLDSNSADMEYVYEQWEDMDTNEIHEDYNPCPIVKVEDVSPNQLETLPAWSLNKILNIIKDLCNKYGYEYHIMYEFDTWRISLYPFNNEIYPLIEAEEETILNCAVETLKKFISKV